MSIENEPLPERTKDNTETYKKLAPITGSDGYKLMKFKEAISRARESGRKYNEGLKTSEPSVE